MKKSYEVMILNQKFVLRTEQNEEHVKKVTEFVNKTFNDIKERAKNISTQNVAILAALNIAEQMLVREEEMKGDVAEWKSRLENILEYTS